MPEAGPPRRPVAGSGALRPSRHVTSRLVHRASLLLPTNARRRLVLIRQRAWHRRRAPRTAVRFAPPYGRTTLPVRWPTVRGVRRTERTGRGDPVRVRAEGVRVRRYEAYAYGVRVGVRGVRAGLRPRTGCGAGRSRGERSSAFARRLSEQGPAAGVVPSSDLRVCRRTVQDAAVPVPRARRVPVRGVRVPPRTPYLVVRLAAGPYGTTPRPYETRTPGEGVRRTRARKRAYPWTGVRPDEAPLLRRGALRTGTFAFGLPLRRGLLVRGLLFAHELQEPLGELVGEAAPGA